VDILRILSMALLPDEEEYDSESAEKTEEDTEEGVAESRVPLPKSIAPRSLVVALEFHESPECTPKYLKYHNIKRYESKFNLTQLN
jgi:hypothetical protein